MRTYNVLEELAKDRTKSFSINDRRFNYTETLRVNESGFIEKISFGESSILDCLNTRYLNMDGWKES